MAREREGGSKDQSQTVSQVKTQNENDGERCRRLEDQDQHKAMLAGAGKMCNGA